jgi:hypothetical protein
MAMKGLMMSKAAGEGEDGRREGRRRCIVMAIEGGGRRTWVHMMVMLQL